MINLCRAVAAATLLAVLVLAGCNGDEGTDDGTPIVVHKDDGGNVSAHGASATNAVCSATSNAYFKDAIRSNITGRAIRDLSDKQGVADGVKSAVHNLFNEAGNAPKRDDEMNVAYNLVIERCRKAGWS
jgi:hypothetical protein